jgi:hypothetical protein
MDGLFEQDAPKMPTALADTIRVQIRRDTQPVTPMMSTAAYALLLGGVFAAAAILFASIIGFKGLPVLSLPAAIAILSVLVALALWSGWMVARSIRPAGGPLHSWLSVGLVIVTYESLVLTFFADHSTNRFLHQGLACLSLGVLCASFTAVPVWFIVRRGFIVDSVRAGAVIGLVTGLAGLTALTLHCDVITAPHASVWHAAVIVVCVGVGVLAGRLFQRQ